MDFCSLCGSELNYNCIPGERVTCPKCEAEYVVQEKHRNYFELECI